MKKVVPSGRRKWTPEASVLFYADLPLGSTLLVAIDCLHLATSHSFPLS